MIGTVLLFSILLFQMNCAFDVKSTKIGGKLDLNVLIQLKMGDT